MKILLLLILSISCTHLAPGGSPKEGKTTYSYTDESGTFQNVREFKTIKQNLVTRNQLLSTAGSGKRLLEKSVIVSQIGSIKADKKRLKILRPLASEFTVWLEGKKYFSSMRLNPKNKSMQLKVTTPEKGVQASEVNFPKGKYFCFFNQIPECLYHNYLLQRAHQEQTRRFDFYLIWDAYPILQEQLSGVGKKLFVPATLKFDGEIKKTFRYIVEVEGQLIVYQFSRSYDLKKISWIAQGISIVPPGEEVVGE